MEKELREIDVVPRVRMWLLQALKEKYQKSNYWILTKFGYGQSIWHLKKTFSDYFKSWTTSLLIWFVRNEDNSLIRYYLSLADNNAWDWKLACNAKTAALNDAATYGKMGPLEVLLADKHVPLSLSAKQRAMELANHPAIIQVLKDSIDKQAEPENEDPFTIWSCIEAITPSFRSHRRTPNNETTLTTKPRPKFS